MYLQWTLTYTDTSVPKLTVRINESLSLYIIIIGSQRCVRISEASHYMTRLTIKIFFSTDKSPPKVLLKDNSKTLIQADLVPASLVYFGLEGDCNTGNSCVVYMITYKILRTENVFNYFVK